MEISGTFRRKRTQYFLADDAFLAYLQPEILSYYVDGVHRAIWDMATTLAELTESVVSLACVGQVNWETSTAHLATCPSCLTRLLIQILMQKLQ